MDLKLPHLGEGADSGTVVNLFVKEGDPVSKNQPILELENEKAVATIPATAAGTISKIYVKTGDKISVGQRILTLSQGGPAPAALEAKASAPPHKAPAVETKEEPAEHEQARQEMPEHETKPGLSPAAAPSIRKLARDLGIDLSRVRGSERGGRIILGDLRAYIQRLQMAGAQPATTAPVPAANTPVDQIDFSKWGPVSKKPLSPLRQVIARRMLENWQAVPRVTQFDDADITGMSALVGKHAAAYSQKGARLTLTCMVLKTVVETLKKHRIFNSSLDDGAQEIVLKEYYHIGIAVDTEAGLIVPVIRDVDKKSMFQLAQELEALAKKARERKVAADELKGGTFTISNQGGIGSAHFTPIVNKPEVAILGLGRGRQQAVVRGGAIEVRTMLPLGLSYDHRVIDGGAAARFMVDLVKALESFRGEDVKL